MNRRAVHSRVATRQAARRVRPLIEVELWRRVSPAAKASPSAPEARENVLKAHFL